MMTQTEVVRRLNRVHSETLDQKIVASGSGSKLLQDTFTIDGASRLTFYYMRCRREAPCQTWWGLEVVSDTPDHEDTDLIQSHRPYPLDTLEETIGIGQLARDAHLVSHSDEAFVPAQWFERLYGSKRVELEKDCSTGRIAIRMGALLYRIAPDTGQGPDDASTRWAIRVDASLDAIDPTTLSAPTIPRVCQMANTEVRHQLESLTDQTRKTRVCLDAVSNSFSSQTKS